MIKTFKIPDRFYEYGEPYRDDYLEKGDREGLTYKNGGEEAYEMAAAFGGSTNNQWSTVSLLSPYILGWDSMGTERKLIAADIEARTVLVDITPGKEEPKK